MRIDSTRFGAVTIEPEDILTFPQGLIGWEDLRHWVLLCDAENASLGWLQCVSRPEVALPVVSPRKYVPDYQARVKKSQLSSLEITPDHQAFVLAVLAFAVIQGAGKPQWEDLLLLGAVGAAAYGYAEGARLSREIGSWQVIWWTLVVTGPFVIPFVVVDLGGQGWDASFSGWVGLAYVSLVSMYLGFLAWYKGLALGGIARVGQIQLAQPVLTLVWSWLWLGESIGWLEIAAGLVIVGSVALTRRYRYEVAPPQLASDSRTESMVIS